MNVTYNHSFHFRQKLPITLLLAQGCGWKFDGAADHPIIIQTQGMAAFFRFLFYHVPLISMVYFLS